MNKNIKNLTFKIKKVVYENYDKVKEVYQGIIMPSWNERYLEFSEDYISLYTLEGQILEFNINRVKIENTRIMDKKIKDKLDKLIGELKEEHKIRLEEVKLKLDYLAKLEKLKNKSTVKREKVEKNIEDLLKVQGFITIEKFEQKILDLVNAPFGYRLNFRFKGTKILNATLTKEVDLGRYLTESDYDFIYLEYDNTVMVANERLDKSKDFAHIKKEYFKPVKTSKLDKYKVFEEFNVFGGGDKGSADAYHEITLRFNDGIDITKKNVKEVKDSIEKLIKYM